MKILMAASEVEPFSKTGGLADVLGSLPPELARSGHDVGVIAPLYRTTKLDHPELFLDNLKITLGPDTHSPRVLTVTDGGVKFYFVDYPAFFDRSGLYGTPHGDYPDNAQRFLLFSKVVLEMASILRPAILHVHDWQTAMAPVLLKTSLASARAIGGMPVLLTIHNLGYQGIFDASLMGPLGLAPSLLSIDGIEFYGKINFLKGGLMFSDALTTVSEAYAREIQTKEYGFGLDGLLSQRRDVLSGVLNGVNYDKWDPRTDFLIASNYGPDNLTGKRTCKRDLIENCGVADDDLDRPIIGMVSRIVEQKGADLVSAAMQDLMAMDLSMVMLGSGDGRFLDLFRSLEVRYPRRFVLKIAQDETLAHKIEAGSDVFLMPSRYEPCGLNQMYSLRYGTVPVVRATGGLDDTIQSFNPALGTGNGFKFREYGANALVAAVEQALEVFADRPVWQSLMRTGMSQSFGWDRAVPKYEAIYARVLASRSGAPAV